MAQLRALRREQPLADFLDVPAAVAVRGEGELLAAVLQIPQPGADRQNLHLAAGVVDVVLLEQIGDARAEGGMPAVADMQGTGGIGGHELHLHRSACAGERSAVMPCLLQHLGDFRVIGVLGKKEVDEAGARDLDLGHRRAARQQAQQCVGQLAGILARRLGQLHGQIARKIAVLRVARVFDLHVHAARAGRHQVFRQCRQRFVEQFFNHGLQGEFQGFFAKGRQFTAMRARNPLNLRREDPRRWTSAVREGRAAAPRAAATP